MSKEVLHAMVDHAYKTGQLNPGEKVLCLHHDDLDGFASAAIVYKKFKRRCDLCKMSYPGELPKNLSDYNILVMVDFSMPPEIMTELENNHHLIWIDHHISAIEKAKGQKYETVPGIRRNGTAACVLTWEYFYENEPLPLSIEYLGKYDIWDKSDKEMWDDIILPFQYGCQSMSIVSNPTHMFWDNLVFDKYRDQLVSSMTTQGKFILDYIKQANEHTKQYGYTAEFDGLTVAVLNTPMRGTVNVQHIYDPEIHDAMMVLAFDGEKFRVSMYADKPDIDVGKIAVAHGGGGHKGAAGFMLDELPKKIKENE